MKTWLVRIVLLGILAGAGYWAAPQVTPMPYKEARINLSRLGVVSFINITLRSNIPSNRWVVISLLSLFAVTGLYSIHTWTRGGGSLGGDAMLGGAECALLIAGAIGLEAAVYANTAAPPTVAAADLMLILLKDALILGWLICLALSRPGRARLSLGSLHPSGVLPGLFCSAAILPALALLGAEYIVHQDKLMDALVMLYPPTATGQVLAIVVLPLIEEIVFRAGLYRWLRGRIGAVPANLAVSALFAVLHGWTPLSILRGAGSVLMTYLYEKTGNLWSSVTSHAFFNALVSLIPAYLKVG